MEKYILGLDVGGTKTEAAIIRFGKNLNAESAFGVSGVGSDHEYNEGTFLTRKRIPTQRTSGYENVLGRIAELCGEVISEAGISKSDIDGIGIGLPGAVDPEKQIMLNGNSLIFIGKNITHDLKERLNLNVQIKCHNDANCFALAESLCGAGLHYSKKSKLPVDKQTSVGIILGTGLGGGIVHGGKILAGRFGGGGEIGHSLLITGGHPCYCGRNGCAEQYLSGTGLEGMFAARRYAQIKELPGSRKIYELASDGDPLSIAIIKNHKRLLVKFLVNLTNILDPNYFILGGGVSNQEFLYKNIEEEIERESFLPCEAPKVYKHHLGDSAGVIGAALLLLD